jgi:hypothetical protein
MFKDSTANVKGQIGLWNIHEVRGKKRGQVLRRWIEPVTFRPNQIQYSWGFIAAQTIGRGQVAYKLSAMYIEFENVASPGDPVTIPTFGKDEGTDYYDDLQASGTRDFLRVPLLQDPLVGIATGYEEFFTAGTDGNKITLFSQTQGVLGIHGKTFSDSVNSTVFGAALVATPVFADRTQDIMFARAYFPVDEQTLKEASRQLGVSWEVSFQG